MHSLPSLIVIVFLMVSVMSAVSPVYVCLSSRCLWPASTYFSLSSKTIELPLSAVLMITSCSLDSFLIMLIPFLGRLYQPPRGGMDLIHCESDSIDQVF